MQTTVKAPTRSRQNPGSHRWFPAPLWDSHATLVREDDPEYTAWIASIPNATETELAVPSSIGLRHAAGMIGERFGLEILSEALFLGSHHILRYPQGKNAIFRELDGVASLSRKLMLIEIKTSEAPDVLRHGIEQLEHARDILWLSGEIRGRFDDVVMRLVHVGNTNFNYDLWPHVQMDDRQAEAGVIRIRTKKIDAIAEKSGIELPVGWDDRLGRLLNYPVELFNGVPWRRK